MHESVYRVMSLLCAVVSGVPLGTNLGLVSLLWMLLSGRLLAPRGAVIPGLSAAGLAAPAVRRAWAALGPGRWTSAALLAAWRAVVTARAKDEQAVEPARVHELAHAVPAPVALGPCGRLVRVCSCYCYGHRALPARHFAGAHLRVGPPITCERAPKRSWVCPS